MDASSWFRSASSSKTKSNKMASKESNTEAMYQELLKRFSETRKLNMKLLEEKRELLLRIQEENVSHNDRPVSSHGREEDDVFEKRERSSTIEMREFEDSRPCSCGSETKLKRLMEMNQNFQEQYDNLTLEYRELRKGCEKMEKELQDDREENARLKELVGKLSSDLEKLGLTQRYSRSDEGCSNEEIEILKQQLLVFKEDFENEREDKEKLLKENRFLEDQLKDTENRLESITEENRKYRLCLRQITNQKEHLVAEMRRLSSTSALPFSPVHEQQIPIDARFNPARCGYEDVIPRSTSTSPPRFRKTSPTAFMGAPAAEDSKCF